MSTIVTRAGKGSPLTWNEVDNNFTNLNTDKLQSGNTAAALTITSATINGGTITGTALNGTLGATTPSTIAATTISASGVSTFSAGTAGAPALTTTGDTNTGIFFPAADTIAFSEGGTESMRINSAGNLGLGVTPSAWFSTYKALQISTNGSLVSNTDFFAFSNNSYVTAAGTETYLTTGFAGRYRQVTSTGSHQWYTAASGTTGATITDFSAAKMTLDVSGNLTVVGGATIQGLTVGRGNGAVATNTAVGASAMAATATGAENVAFGGLALTAVTSGRRNTAVGYATLAALTTNQYNTAFGNVALNANTADHNTGIGYIALGTNTTGNSNTGVGSLALNVNTTGSNNTALGMQALVANTTASNNTAVGYQALYSNTTALNNTAIGYLAGYSTTTGGSNIFIGMQAGYSNTTALGNTFIGKWAGFNSNTTGYVNNTFVGSYAGANVTTGKNNTFVGGSEDAGGAGYNMTTGSKNTIIGLYNGNQGGLDIRTASNYIVLSDGDGNAPMYYSPAGGWFAGLNVGGDYGFSVRNNSATGYGYFSQLNNSGTTYRHFTGYSLSTSTFNYFVFSNGNVANTNNSYGAISDIKLKENIVDATPKLEDLCKVKIRQYNLKSDPNHKQIGVIAQELEEIFPAMIDECEDQDSDGNNLGTVTKQVKYSVFVPMLIKAIQELKAEIDLLKGTK